MNCYIFENVFNTSASHLPPMSLPTYVALKLKQSLVGYSICCIRFPNDILVIINVEMVALLSLLMYLFLQFIFTELTTSANIISLLEEHSSRLIHTIMIQST